MAVQLAFSSPNARRPPIVAVEPRPVSKGPGGGRLRAVGRGIWRLLVNAISGPGIDESKLPSSFEAPYGRGSRQIRSLWHMPF
jgi:hypothetical protein